MIFLVLKTLTDRGFFFVFALVKNILLKIKFLELCRNFSTYSFVYIILASDHTEGLRYRLSMICPFSTYVHIRTLAAYL